MNYTLNLTNISIGGNCVLDQAALVESTSKIPKSGYYVLLLGLFALVFYFLIQPRLSVSFQESMGNGIGYLGMCLVFLASWVLFLFVFQLESEDLVRVSRFAGYLLIPILALFSWYGYRFIKGRMKVGE